MKKQFDRFMLTELIAQGVGGSLFGGNERLPGGVTRPVRVKVMPALAKSDPAAEARFVEEIRVLAALATQPHIITFYGMGITDNIPWIALEDIPVTVESLLSNTPGNPADVAQMLKHAARALSALHGLVPPRLHNSLRPANILICAEGRHFKVTEFGLAAPPTAEPMLSADAVRYAAPELIGKDAGKPGPWTDLYALGHVAYEWALGAKLHRQQFPAITEGAANVQSISPAKWQAWHHSIGTVVAPAHEVVKGFPHGLGEIIARMMAKPVASRYASAAELLTALASAVDAAPIADVAPLALPAADNNRQRTPPAPPPVDSMRPPPPPTRVDASRPPPPREAPEPERATGALSGERYFVRLRNRTSGPFDVATLQRLGKQGQISRLHQVSTDQRNWKSATSVEGLFS